MARDDDLVPVFVPTLASILIHAEDLKGSPLTQEEALRIRDEAVCIMMERGDAAKMDESRGYRDIDPENCWHDWQLVRRDLGREPALPPGPRFAHLPRDDAGFLRTMQQAQSTLDHFRRLIADLAESGTSAMIKAEITENDQRAFMWLAGAVSVSGGFTAELFEVPSGFRAHKVGEQLTVADEAVLDWSMNDNGRLHGGFSLRYQRSNLPESERAAFDEYIGVTEYV